MFIISHQDAIIQVLLSSYNVVVQYGNKELHTYRSEQCRGVGVDTIAKDVQQSFGRHRELAS